VRSDPVELTKQIKAANDIVNVVGSYLALRPAGPVFKALCPFHTDSHPSLDVDPRRQRYRCWACGKHGDVITFVQEMEKVAFLEARQILATRAGIKLDDSPNPQDQVRSRLLNVTRWAQEKYQNCLLNDPIAEPARKYLGSRKLSGKTVRDFGLGFAPLEGDWLVKQAFNDRISDDVLVEVGLTAVRQEQRGHYDRFRDRVMFPIRDVQKRPIGFGGRIMPESPYASRAPKYYNSAETPLFSKSDVLYGLDSARHDGAAAGYLAVVEGYTDVMMAHQCGVTNIVATMGTALNARHVAQLRRYVPKVVLVYDADAGGLTGVDRALEIFISQDVELAVATLPDGLDPCDLLVRSDGVETFQRILASAVSALDFFFVSRLGHEGVPSVEMTRAIIDQVLRLMAKSASWKDATKYDSNSRVKQELILTRLASRLHLKHETIWARFGEVIKEERTNAAQQAAKDAPPLVQASAARVSRPSDEGSNAKSSAIITAQLNLVELLLAHPLLVGQAEPIVGPQDFTHPDARRVLEEIYAIHAEGLTPDMDLLRERLLDRPELFEKAEKRRYIGQHMQEPEQNLERILGWFARQKRETEERSLMAQLKSDSLDPEAAREIMARLKELQGSRRL
jgi:DNA primase